MTVNATAGTTTTLTLEFFDQSSGILVDPTSVQLDITYGSVVGAVPDVAGPFTYQGSSAPSSIQVYRTGVGQYAYQWPIPLSGPDGVYIANWTCVYGPTGGTSPGVEDVVVTGAGITPPTQGDIGYWTGTLAYNGLTVALGAVDVTGTAWVLERVQGWDGPDTSGQVVQRGSDHGGWASPQYYGPRNITLTVRASATTQAERDVARAALQQVVPVSDLGLFTYGEPVPKQASVRRSGRLIETYPTLGDVEFTIGLVAPDPRKYATISQSASATTAVQQLGLAPPWTPPITLPAQPVGGFITITNNGNFETRPVITINGPIAAPAVYNTATAELISFSQLTLGASDSLVLDLDQRTGTFNGMYTPADLTSAWFVCQPGSTVLELQGSLGAGSVISAVWSDAYI